MKIISKYKDYYDYLVGTYGIDPVMVYDRRFDYCERYFEFPSDALKEMKVYIAGKIYVIQIYKGEFYHTPQELMDLHFKMKKDGLDVYISRTYGHRWWKDRNKPPGLEFFQREFDEDNHKDTNINFILRTPIVVSTTWKDKADWKIDKVRDQIVSSYYSSILLKDYGFPKWYTADEMYQKICTFISYLKDHPEIPNKQSNIEKLLSHGFDKKKSFRHRK